MFPTMFGKEALRGGKELPEKLQHDCRIMRTRLGEYYLCVVEDYVPPAHEGPRDGAGAGWGERPAGEGPRDGAGAGRGERPACMATRKTAALDPGVRTFMTIYCPEDATVIQWGANDQDVLWALANRHAYLQALRVPGAVHPGKGKAVRHAQRYRLGKVQARIRERMRNLVDEVHRKLALFLVISYDTIVIPKFGVLDMVARDSRVINSRTVRNMLTWSHARFRARLVDQAARHGKRVFFCDEAYTSMTCTRCGELNHDLRSNKEFHCAHCGLTCDRDEAAARNILLRAQQQLVALWRPAGVSSTPM